MLRGGGAKAAMVKRRVQPEPQSPELMRHSQCPCDGNKATSGSSSTPGCVCPRAAGNNGDASFAANQLASLAIKFHSKHMTTNAFKLFSLILAKQQQVCKWRLL